jgi:hypothetical protein
MEEHQKRVVEEAKELKTKLDKLGEFIAGDMFVNVVEDEQNRLIRQERIMTEYYDVLTERIDAF